MTVKQKQWQLYYLGYYGGEIDGVWGAQSKAAAVRFQKDYNLDADGVFGALTIAKSAEIIKAVQKEITDGKSQSMVLQVRKQRMLPFNGKGRTDWLLMA